MSEDRGDGDDGDRVGYGRPPKQHRFQKGRSGNPSGRRKGSHNVRTLIDVELSKQITITDRGRRRRVTMAQLVAKQVVNKAVKGEDRAVALLLAHLDARAVSSNQTPVDDAITPEDEALLRNFITRRDRPTEASDD